MKGRKLLFVGVPDSGKTIWFTPFYGEYYIYFKTFKVMLSRKDLLQLFDCIFIVL